MQISRLMNDHWTFLLNVLTHINIVSFPFKESIIKDSYQLALETTHANENKLLQFNYIPSITFFKILFAKPNFIFLMYIGPKSWPHSWSLLVLLNNWFILHYKNASITCYKLKNGHWFGLCWILIPYAHTIFAYI